MSDNLLQDEKSVKQIKSRKFMLIILGLAFCVIIPHIIQRFYAEVQKDKMKTEARTIMAPRQPTETGIGLSDLVMALQQKRDAQRIPLFEPDTEPKSEDKPAEQVVSVPAPPKRKLKVPDEEMVKLGAQLRSNKLLALFASSRVEGFAAAEGAPGGGMPGEPTGQTPQFQQLSQADLDDSDLLAAAGLNALRGAGAEKPEDPNRQQDKMNFLYSKAAGLTPQGYSANIPVPQQFPYELKAGTLIPGIMISGLNSDLPGAVMGQVSEHVFDTATGANILIPKGSRIIGVYDSQVTYGQKRVMVVWNRIIAPNGTSLSISGSQGMDRAGYSGMTGRVDNHWGRIIGTALLASAFVAGAETIAPNTAYGDDSDRRKTPSEIMSEAVANTVLDIGAKITEKASNIQPTIKIRPGTRFNVFVAQDIIFPTTWETR